MQSLSQYAFRLSSAATMQLGSVTRNLSMANLVRLGSTRHVSALAASLQSSSVSSSAASSTARNTVSLTKSQFSSMMGVGGILSNNNNRIFNVAGKRMQSSNANANANNDNVNAGVRNIAIIAHVDHGKTTLVDALLAQGGKGGGGERVMDSMDLEVERGVTIRSKVTAIDWKGHRINIVDTPGHADFSGEVERVMHLVNAVLLIVDSTEGVMVQTKFVLSKALAAGLHPIVVINKIDRDSARTKEVEEEVFDLFIHLNATEEQLDFPFLYASGREGWCTTERDGSRTDGMAPLLDAVLKYVPAPSRGDSPDFSMVVSMLSHDRYVGRLLQGRIASGSIKVGDPIKAIRKNEKGEVIQVETGRVTRLTMQHGTVSEEVQSADAGHIVQIAGLANATVADTVGTPSLTTPLKSTPVDPPTVSMTFGANDSPFQGKEGNKLTSQAIADRLKEEIMDNVSISLKATQTEAVEVMGRGEMQLGVLIETMRREGFEMSISPPRVVLKVENGVTLEPTEEVVIEVDDNDIGPVMEALTKRGGNMEDMKPSGDGRTRLNFIVPSRGLIGFKSYFKMQTRGGGIIYSSFHSYQKFSGGLDRPRKGVLISSAQGTTTAYALNQLESRGTLFVGPRVEAYVGMIVGEHNRDQDLEVNPTKAKQLTNMRAAGSEENIFLSPPREFTLEDAMGYVLEDEMIEVTPKSVRLRKAILDPSKRKRPNRG